MSGAFACVRAEDFPHENFTMSESEFPLHLGLSSREERAGLGEARRKLYSFRPRKT